jgi:hypothetical protein
LAQRQVSRLSDDELHADWVRWIERIYFEAIAQGWRHKMFRLLRCISDQNPRLLETGGFFLNWAAENYVAAAAMAFRRELDTQGGTENLFHLLKELEKRPQALTRARFKSTWNAHTAEDCADDAFDELPIIRHPDTPELDHIDPAMVEDDLRRLTQQDAVLTHIQTTIAHRMPERNAPIPTFREFHEAVDAVGKVFEKYYLILTHHSLYTREPAPQYNVYAPFRFAWIADSDTFDYNRCE